MEEKMLAKCLEWDEFASEENVTVVGKEDDGQYHKRIYLIARNDDDGYTHVLLLRVWTVNDGKSFELSEDYTNCTRIDDFVDTIPDIVKEINRVS